MISKAQQKMADALLQVHVDLSAEIARLDTRPTLQDLEQQRAEVAAELDRLDPTILNPPKPAESDAGDISIEAPVPAP